MSPTSKKSTDSSNPVDIVQEIDDLEKWSDKPDVLFAQQCLNFFERFDQFVSKKRR